MTASDPRTPSALSLLCAPYQDLLPVKHLDALEAHPRLTRGAAVVWELGAGDWGNHYRTIRDRPAGVALIMILPRAHSLDAVSKLLEAAEQCRPHSVLPFHPNPAPEDLTSVLRRTPHDLASDVMDYLTWRGLRVDQDTRRIVRRIVELSRELKSVSAVARSLYMSRRSLGRRFKRRGLPVPSHVLHFSRLLRASLALQESSRTLFEIGCELGYSDGFALSNQMVRLTGLRPRLVRKRIGWEWIVEAWLQREAASGAVTLRTQPATPRSLPAAEEDQVTSPPVPEPSSTRGQRGSWRRTARVAEGQR